MAPYADYSKTLASMRRRYQRMTEEDREAQRTYQRERLAARREEIRSRTRSAACEDCGATGVRLHWHHRNPAEKIDAVLQLASRSMAVIEEEIAKCDLLCVPCHHKRHKELRRGCDN